MNREKALAKEIDLKAKLKTAIRRNDNTSKRKIRKELIEVRKLIGTVTTQEAYGQMSY